MRKNRLDFEMLKVESKSRSLRKMPLDLRCGSENTEPSKELDKIHIFVFHSISFFFSLAFRLTPIISHLSSPQPSRHHAFEYVPNFTAKRINWIYANTQHFFVCRGRSTFDKYFVPGISGISERLSIAVHDIWNMSETATLRELYRSSTRNLQSMFRYSSVCHRKPYAMNRKASDVI